MFCRNCGAKLENGYSCCPKCGVKVETVNNQNVNSNCQTNTNTTLSPKKGKKGLICILSSIGLFSIIVVTKLVLDLNEVEINDNVYSLISVVQVYGSTFLFIAGVILAILKK